MCKLHVTKSNTMKRILCLIILGLLVQVSMAQWNYFNQYGLLDENVLDELIGEA